MSGETGWLIEDPNDLTDFGAALSRLLSDPAEAARLGDAGRRRATELFLGDRHLEQWAHVFARLG